MAPSPTPPAPATPGTLPAEPASSPWAVWLAWGWVVLLLLVVIAELTGWNDLRLALDFQRHF